MNISSLRKRLELIIPGSRTSDRRLFVARLAWVLVAAALLAMAVYAVASHSRWIATDLPASELKILADAGIPAAAYSVFLAVLELLVASAFGTAALVIFWSKRDDGTALLVSFALITFGATVFPFLSSAGFAWLARPVQIFGIAAAALTVFLFPDGRFVPSWTRSLAFGLGIWLTALLVLPEITAAASSVSWLAPVQTGLRVVAWLLGTDISADFIDQAVAAFRTLGLLSMLIGGFGAGAFSQIYRYLHASNRQEKQQTKLVVFGLTIAVAASLAYYLLPAFAPPLREPGGLRLVFQAVSQTAYSIALVLVPVFLMIAVLRYRLWDVDQLINRTLVYALLTGLLGALYLFGIYFFQAIVRAATGQNSELVIVGSTLAIAALFRPLRDRLQDFIDRRFYREKVDFRLAFTEFGRELRTLFDLDELQRTLVLRVTQLLHIQYGAVFLREGGGSFALTHAHGLPEEGAPTLPPRPDILERLEGGGIAAKSGAMPFPLLLPLIAPRTGHKDLVGILALGPRLSGEEYSREDQSLLLGLADQAGTAIRVAQLIEEKQAEARQRAEIERQLAEHWNSPLGRAEATADQILLHPQGALAEFHRLTQEARDNPDSAALVANLPNALENAKAGGLARLAEGFSYLLESHNSPEMLPVSLRTITAQLRQFQELGNAPAGAVRGLAIYSACLNAAAARSVSEIAGWTAASDPPGPEEEFFTGLRAMLAELQAASNSLQAYERVDTAQDKLAYLAGAMERLGRLHHAAHSALGAADRPVIRRIAEHWMAVVTGAMGELHSRAQIVCELLTRHTWQEDVVVLGLSLRNAGRGAAVRVEVRLQPSGEYAVLDGAAALAHLGPGEDAQVEFRVRPRLASGLRRFRALFEIRYTDPRGADQCESFADAVQLLETPREFRAIPNPYVVGTPLRAGSPLFFGREDVMGFLCEHLTAAHRNNLVLIGQRRTGKSSLLKQLTLRLGEGFLPVYLDGQALGLDPGMPAFLHSVASEIAFAMEDRGMAVAPPSLDAYAENPTYFFERNFLPEVRRSLGSRPLLLLLDEFEELESSVRRGTLDAAVFPFLRHLIQHSENLSVVFCGTHRLEELASDYWSVLFNISLYRHIGLLSREEAMRLIQEPVAGGGMQYDDLALEKIWRVTAGHPYFLQLVCHNLVNLHNRLTRSYLTVADVNASLEEILTAGEAHFVYLWTESTPAQKLALFAMSQPGRAAILTPIQAADSLAHRGVAADRTELIGAFQRLAARDIFSVVQRPDLPYGEAYGWKLGLLGMWVEKSKSLRQVVDEEKNRG
ncbi:MAG: GAF domain-containing protein [Anaerolineales bacterium]|nr:GAF domain-containing protein [Anaerolineales bacterium]